MPKSNIRPPKTPKGEAPSITIANLNLQIKHLTQRCVDLVTSRDQETRHAIEYRGQRDAAQQQATHGADQNYALQSQVDGLSIDLAHLRGYQERVREEDKHRYGDLPGVSA